MSPESPALSQVLDALRIGRVACEWAGHQQDADKITAAMETVRMLPIGVLAHLPLPEFLMVSDETTGETIIHPKTPQDGDRIAAFIASAVEAGYGEPEHG